MNEHAETLRRRIAAYRRHIAEGLPSELARAYLGKIANAEAELAEIEHAVDERERPTRHAKPHKKAAGFPTFLGMTR